MTSDNDSMWPVESAEPGADEPAAAKPRPASERVLKLRDVEAAHIHYVLQAANWNKREAARALGISRDTLYRKIAEHALEPRDGGPARRPSTSRR